MNKSILKPASTMTNSVPDTRLPADPVALLAQALVAFGSIVGRNPYFQIEATQHFTNLFITLVGETAKARKGTSWEHVKSVFGAIDEEWKPRVKSGLSSGEGLIWEVRDEVWKPQ